MPLGSNRRQKRREERQDERQTFGRGGDAVRYQMRQKMVSIGDDFWIENSNGERVFKVDGKALRVRKTLKFEDANGDELAKIQERIARIRDTMKVEGPDGSTLATIKKAMITPLRERYTISTPDGELKIQGNIVDHEYEIEADGHKVAEVSKKWFRVRDTYGVEITQGQNDIVILAATVAVDMISHPTR
ncbi:MAG: LURP-one-related family protein [Actinomycetota bacterium]